MTLDVDRIYEYAGYFGRPARCRLRLYRDPDGPAAVLVPELPDNPGTSVTNRAGKLAEAVCSEFGLDPDTLTCIEHYPNPDRYRRVTFRPICWEAVTRDRVEALIGQPLDGESD